MSHLPPAGDQPYIGIAAPVIPDPPAEDQAMLSDVYNKRILELAGNIPLLDRLPTPDATRHGAFEAMRLDRDSRSDHGRRCRHRLRA